MPFTDFFTMHFHLPKTDFEDPASGLGDRRFRISYAGGTNTVKKAMEKFHHFWPTWVKLVLETK